MIALLLLLAACGSTLPAVTHQPLLTDDAAAISATVDAWRAYQGLPDLDPYDVAQLLVTDAASADVFLGRCSACPPTDVAPACVSRRFHGLRANACSVFDDRCSGPFCGLFTDSARLIVLAPGREPGEQRRSLIVHETIHHLLMMAGLDGDADHSDGRLWCDYSAGGCAGNNVEHVAREALR